MCSPSPDDFLKEILAGGVHPLKAVPRSVFFITVDVWICPREQEKLSELCNDRPSGEQ